MTDETKAFLVCLAEAAVILIGGKIGKGEGFTIWLLLTLLLVTLVYADRCKSKANNAKQRRLINQQFKSQMDELRKGEKY